MRTIPTSEAPARRAFGGSQIFPILVVVSIASVSAIGCVSTRNTTQVADPNASDAITEIDLSRTRGEVGRPFESQLTFEQNFSGPVETKVDNLPKGLRYDPASHKVVGKPSKAGFFTVQASVRKKIERGKLHRPTPDERWFVKELEISIYEPVE